MNTNINSVAAIWKGAQKALINVFIVGYVLGSFVMCYPPSQFHDAAVSAVKPFFNFFGLYQFFCFYAPNPQTVHRIHVWAEIYFRDGSKKLWEFPRLDNFKNDFYQHQSNHRFYMWKNYIYSGELYPEIFPDAARFVARINWNPQNPPVTIIIYTQPVLTVLSRFDDGRDLKSALPVSKRFTYVVRPEEL